MSSKKKEWARGQQPQAIVKIVRSYLGPNLAIELDKIFEDVKKRLERLGVDHRYIAKARIQGLLTTKKHRFNYVGFDDGQVFFSNEHENLAVILKQKMATQQAGSKVFYLEDRLKRA